MQNNRPVFESFDQFVKFVYEAAQLNEADTAYASPLLKLIKGAMKLDGQSATELNTLILKTFNKIYTDFDKTTSPIVTDDDSTGKKEVTELMNELTMAFDALNNSAGLETIPGSVISSEVTPAYKYLVSGTLRAKDVPMIDNRNIGSTTDGEITAPLSLFLVAINSANLFALANLINSAKKRKAYVNAGSQADLDQFDEQAAKYPSLKFVEINPSSLSGELITVKPYESTYAQGDVKKPKNETPEQKEKREKDEKEKKDKDKILQYGWQFPLYGLAENAIGKGAGELVDANYYDVVIAPAGNDVKVTSQEYSAPPEVKFFGENEVTISEAGKRQLNAILSQYNSVEKIIVNGGASSKSTTYRNTNPLKVKNAEGKEVELKGNEALAYDRMNAGITLLNALKKDKVAQLASTIIEPGTAKVQAEGESDAKNQQVSFIVTGMIKSIEIVPKDPVIISTMEDLKADTLTFTKYVLQLNVNAEPNVKNMAARA
jgi:hypothetical protein